MSNKKSITKNYIYNVIYQILIIIIPLITTPYLSRVLGAESIGIYSYTLSITTYFILFGSLGISVYAQREIAYVQENKEEKSKIFWEIFMLRAITLTISMIIFYIIFAINGEYKIYYRIFMIEIIANCFDISWFFQGLEEFKKTVMRNIIVKLISVILIFVLVKSADNLKEYILIYVLSTLIGNLSLWLYIPKYVNKVNIKKLKIKRHIKTTLELFIPQIAIQIYTVLDKTMLGAIINDKSEVGYYEQAQKIVKLLLVITTSLGTVMIPRMANLFANNNKKEIEKNTEKSFKFMFLVGIPLMLGIISVADKFVPIFYGSGYDKVSILIKIISPIVIIIGLSNVIGTQYLLPTKRQKEYTISVIVGAIINFSLNIFFIKAMASVGSSISTVIAEMFVTLVQIYCVRKEINFIKIFKGTNNYIIAGILMFVLSFGVAIVIKDNITSIIVQVLAGGSCYIITLLLLKDEFVLENIKKFKRKNRSEK